MNILILDNYDSFTYNLVHYVEDITGTLPDVYRNDEISIDEIKRYDGIILSPGPGIPEEAGILKEVIKTYAGKIPIFGVCLGLQAIAEVFGGELENLNDVFHGVATAMKVIQTNTITFKDIPEKFEAARYHSWIASYNNFPEELEITAIDDNNSIMALRHREHHLEAVQFHPESILTPEGKTMIQNFIESIKK
ncbi:anthranilate synthase component II [Tenacibaculum maritimum]|uniref:anthranilate synthase component II n=1 Tax=Tenacibaculum maritimum TaxID=107401 RepID=UPI00387649B3